MAHDEDGAFSRDRFELVKSRQDEDSGLSETRLGLAEHVDIQNCGRDADLLDCDKAERNVRLEFDSKGEKENASQMSVHPPESSNL